MTKTISFDEICKKATKRYLKTVVIVDNEPQIITNPENPRPSQVQTATRILPPTPPPPSTISEDVSEAHTPIAASDSESIRAEPSAQEETNVSGTSFNVHSHNIDIRTVVNAFAQHNIICGTYLPLEVQDPQQIQKETKALLKPSDVAIIDWQLKKNDASIAKQIIKDILEEDSASGGYHRLIIVYTGEQDLQNVVKQLKTEISDFIIEETLQEPDLYLNTKYARICFLNKPNILKDYLNNNKNIVEWVDLPDRIIDEFAKFSEGLLRSFALESIAALREDSHRLIAQFKPELDSAFAGQRASLIEPDEASFLMTDIVMSEILLTLKKEKIEETYLHETGVIAWHRNQSLGDIEQITIKRKDGTVINKIDNDQRIYFLKNGTKDMKSTDFKSTSNIFDSFFKNKDLAKSVNKQFSILSTLSYHNGKDVNRPISSPPILSLGIIIQNAESHRMLLCIQPKCDTVRLRAKSSFIFIELEEDSEEKKIDLVLPFEEVLKTFKLNIKAREILYFSPSDSEQVIKAQESDGKYLFRDDQDQNWEWVAEVREIQALNYVNKVTSHLSRIGLNQFEWLRLQSNSNS